MATSKSVKSQEKKEPAPTNSVPVEDAPVIEAAQEEPATPDGIKKPIQTTTTTIVAVGSLFSAITTLVAPFVPDPQLARAIGYLIGGIIVLFFIYSQRKSNAGSVNHAHEPETNDAAQKLLEFYVSIAEQRNSITIPLRDLIFIIRHVPRNGRIDQKGQALIIRSIWAYLVILASMVAIVIAVFVGQRLTNDVGTWSTVDLSSCQANVGAPSALLLPTAKQPAMYVSTYSGLLCKSLDQGKTWKLDALSLTPASSITALGVHADGTVFAATTSGDFYVNNAVSSTWKKLGSWVQPGPNGVTPIKIIQDPSNEDTLYLLSLEGIIYQTQDRGLQWQSLNVGSAAMVTSLALVNASLYAGTSTGELWQFGVNHVWLQIGVSNLPHQQINAIVGDPVNPDVIYIAMLTDLSDPNATGFFQVRVGSSGGISSPLSSSLKGQGIDLLFDPFHHNALYAAIADGPVAILFTDSQEVIPISEVNTFSNQFVVRLGKSKESTTPNLFVMTENRIFEWEPPLRVKFRMR